jgi:hypothetical protein
VINYSAVSLPQPAFSPDDLAAIAPRIFEEGRFQLVVVDRGLGLENDSQPLELDPLGSHVIDPERQMTDPALVDPGLTFGPAQNAGGSPPLSKTTCIPSAPT